MCTINIYLIGWLYALQIIFSRNFFFLIMNISISSKPLKMYLNMLEICISLILKYFIYNNTKLGKSIHLLCCHKLIFVLT